jgi:GNAT superfamily N-acetyltransferase
MIMKNSDHMTSITIREMNKEDLVFAARCTAEEGWVSETLATLEGFFLHDPRGCLLAEENDQPIGICIATDYGSSGFIGELIVSPDSRGRGVGAALLNHGVGLLKARRVETVYLDGVLKAVVLYERNGFKKVCRSWRFSGALPGQLSPYVKHMTEGDIDQVIDLDKRCFGADRSFFLKRRLELFPELSYVMVTRERVTGFILGRGGTDWVAAGPWVVEAGIENPFELLQGFALGANGRSISIGILDTHRQACELVQSYGFVARPDSPWRMAFGSSADLGTSPNCIALGSAAKG